MFIRRTQTRSTPSGQTYFTHRLVRSHRLSGKVRQQTLLNLGRHFSIPRHLTGPCCAAVWIRSSAVSCPCCQEASTQLEEEAQRMAERLLRGRSRRDRHRWGGLFRRPADGGGGFGGVDPSAQRRGGAGGPVGAGAVGVGGVAGRVGSEWTVAGGGGGGDCGPSWPVPARNGPPGAGSAGAAVWASCWTSTSRP